MKINNTHISDHLYSEILSYRKKGARVFLVVPEVTAPDALRSGAVCRNCDGSGKVGIQVVVGGPYSEPRKSSCIWHDGQWFNAKTILDNCPVCSSSGKVALQRQPVAAGVAA